MKQTGEWLAALFFSLLLIIANECIAGDPAVPTQGKITVFGSSVAKGHSAEPDCRQWTDGSGTFDFYALYCRQSTM